MIRQNLHTHTHFDDGTASPMEMAQAALDAGLESLGFSGHAPLPYRDTWEIKPEKMPAYLAAVQETQEAFRERLAVYNGLEWDIVCGLPDISFDYIIGSIHHIEKDGQYFSVDHRPDVSLNTLHTQFHGNKNAMLEAYFSQYAAVAQNPRVDIVGHFDLISKFDEVAELFDGDAPFYRDCAMDALETLLAAGKIFEVNTGAMSRGYRTTPYPGTFFLREIFARKGRVLVTSDSHAVNTIDFGFAKTEQLLADIGFREYWTLGPEGFQAKKTERI